MSTNDERARRGKEVVGKLFPGFNPGQAAAMPAKLMENTVNFVFGEV